MITARALHGNREHFMQDVLAAIKDTPLPTILVVAGIFCLLLSITSQFTGKITVDPTQRFWARAAGGALVVVGIGIYFIGSQPQDRQSTDETVTYELNTDRPGKDYEAKPIPIADPAACQHLCQDDEKCQAYAYAPPNTQGPAAQCWFKYEKPPVVPATGYASGVRGRAHP